MVSRSFLKKAFAEVFKNEPSSVSETRKKKGKKAAQKQKIAIALSKARSMAKRKTSGKR